MDAVCIDGGAGTDSLTICASNLTYAISDVYGNLLHRNTNDAPGTRIAVRDIESILCTGTNGSTQWRNDPVMESWTQTWGGPSNEVSRSVAVDDSGNVYVIASFNGTVDFDTSPTNADLHTSQNEDVSLSKFLTW
jgi:hypothetical protein